MNTSSVLILTFACLSLNAYGDTYHGTITQTVTVTNDPLYHIGDTFVGYYQYQSPSIDGTFYTNNFNPPLTPKPAGALATLDGMLYMPFATSVDIYGGDHLTWGPGCRSNGIDQTMNEGTLVITNGTVSSFFWSWDKGGFYTYVSSGSFMSLSFYDKWPAPGTALPYTSGTVVFSTPTAVPDRCATITLLGGVFLALAALRRRFVS